MEKNKIISEKKVISFDTGANETLALTNIEMEEVSGRLFVFGTIPEAATRNDWGKGVSAGVAWDTVSSYMAFDTLEDYINRLKLSEK